MKNIGSLLLLGSALLVSSTIEARLGSNTDDTDSYGHTVTRVRRVKPNRQAEAYIPENRHKDDTLVDAPKSTSERKLRGNSRLQTPDRHLETDKFHKHLEGHTAHITEEHHRHHENYHHWNEHSQQTAQDNGSSAREEGGMVRGKRRQEGYVKQSTTKKVKPLYILPSASESNFNQTLFEALHNAPFKIYEKAMGHSLGDDESFPVFSMPQWYNSTGVFSAFSKTATPMIFEATQILLDWKNIQSTATGVTRALEQYASDSHFHASLILGKVFTSSGEKVHFVGLIATYYQFGVEKNVLVPFGNIEDFFEGINENRILDPSTKHLEMDALNDMIQHKLSFNGTSDDLHHGRRKHKLHQQKEENSTSPFAIPSVMDIKSSREASLESLEITRFQQLFQVLIRRGFLFSYGYVDCLQQDPYNLRTCLDAVFRDVVRQETSTRGALDEEMAELYGEIQERFPQHASEACINVQSGAMDYFGGSGSCYSTGALRGLIQSNIS